LAIKTLLIFFISRFSLSVFWCRCLTHFPIAVNNKGIWVVSQFERKKYFLHIFLDALQHIAYFFLLKKKGGRSWLQW